MLLTYVIFLVHFKNWMATLINFIKELTKFQLITYGNRENELKQNYYNVLFISDLHRAYFVTKRFFD